MAAVQQRVLNWLYSVMTSEYQDVGRTYSDVAQTLSHYSSLTPSTEVFTYEHGVSALLLRLFGTLPVNFRGTTYRFPISIWVPHTYPREAPLVYVTPADGMIIRAGQHVDAQGKVYHPYLAGWAEFWDKSNVLDLLAILRDVFAKEPPVISRQSRNTLPSTPQLALVPPPVPPPPIDKGGPAPVLAISPDGPPRPPPPPPKPYEALGSPQNPTSNSSLPRENGPPLPPLPPGISRPPIQIQPPMPPYQNSRQPQRQSGLRYETAPPLPPPNILQKPHPSPYSPPHHISTSGSYGPQSYPEAPPGPYQTGQIYSPINSPKNYPNPNASQPLNYNAQSPQSTQWQQVPQQAPPPSKPKPPPPPDLIDEPLIFPPPSSTPLIAPPIPPNPEKDILLHSLARALHAQRQHSLSQTSSSLPGLRAQKSSMLTSLSAMQSEMHALESLSALLTSNSATLHTSLREADAVISSSQGRAPPAVDEILVAPTVVGNQLYELVCEERSLGDALFVLSRAVERGRVGASVFARATRGLAREWYLKKALVKKIGKGMGLVTDPTGFRR